MSEEALGGGVSLCRPVYEPRTGGHPILSQSWLTPLDGAQLTRTSLRHLCIMLQKCSIFRLDGATYRFIAMHTGNETPRVEPFDAVELELALLWGKQA